MLDFLLLDTGPPFLPLVNKPSLFTPSVIPAPSSPFVQRVLLPTAQIVVPLVATTHEFGRQTPVLSWVQFSRGEVLSHLLPGSFDEPGVFENILDLFRGGVAAYVLLL